MRSILRINRLLRMEIYGMTGERLGTIGSSEKKSGEIDLPQWQRDFLSKPSISVRKGIARGYNAPYEDTDTVVLTAHSSRFVDIRLPKAYDPSKPLTEDGSFWAFAGTSTITFPGTIGVPMQHVAHSVWKHDIDSKGAGIDDEGDLFVLPNGDCAEIGISENPRSGKIELYKEYWTSPTAPLDGEPMLKPCVVAELVKQDKSGDLSGLMIQVGDHCQGILGQRGSSDAAVTDVERWTRPRKDADWERDARSGAASTAKTMDSGSASKMVPCSWICNEARQEGDEYVVGEFVWRVTEVHR